MSSPSTRATARERAVVRWERLSAWPFLVLSAVFIVVYSIRCLDPHAVDDFPEVFWWLLVVIWAIFIVDYVARLALSTHRWTFVRRNIPDLLSALIPVFRPFRALVELRRIEFFRGHTGSAVRARLIVYALAFVVLWVYTIAITVVWAERGAPGATIVSLGDALYWAVVTIATVGYGDMVPVTTFGRVLAVMLMLSGIVIVGVTTATIVSYLGDAVRLRRGSDDETARRHSASESEHYKAERNGDQR